MTTNSRRRGWTTVRLGDVVSEISTRIDNPSEAEVDRFVGLEHFDSGELKIRRWGATGDLISAMKLFRRGDTLFARRNAYLRRASMADFDGVCSGDAIVLRPKESAIVQGLLPAVLNTDAFWEYALSHAAGSMSKRVNIRSLLSYEFALPPIEEQKRIAEVLWTADGAVEKWSKCRADLQSLVGSILHEFVEPSSARRWPQKALGEIATVERGKFSYRPRNLPRFYGGPYPFAQTGDVSRANGFIRTFEYTLTEEGKKFSKSFPPGTVLITIAAVIGATAITETETWATDSVVGIVPGGGVDVFFLEYYLRTQRHFLESVAATQTAQKNINLQVLRPLQVPVPPLEHQRSIAQKLGHIQKQVEATDDQMSQCRSLMRAVTNEMECFHV